MRKSLEVQENHEDISDRAVVAKELAAEATVISVASKETKPKEVKPKAAKPKIDLQSLLDEDSKFKKVSNKKSSYSLNVNLYQKAALYFVSKQTGLTKKAVIDQYSFNDIVKVAEKAGLTDLLVKEMFEKSLIK